LKKPKQLPEGYLPLNLDEQIRKHPGMAYYRMLLSYERSKNILSGNSFELRTFIEKLESGEIEHALGYKEFRQRFHDFDGHLVRYLHNFVASVKTLVDHTRSTMDADVIHPEHRVRYQQRVDATFKTSPVAKFVQEFRNYVLHRGVPQTVHETELMPEERTRIYIEFATLAEWDRWSSFSLEFMRQNTPRIRILQLVQDYEHLAIGFHTWFVTDFAKQYAESLKALYELQRKWNAQIGG
jgi:hypothetical protein